MFKYLFIFTKAWTITERIYKRTWKHVNVQEETYNWEKKDSLNRVESCHFSKYIRIKKLFDGSDLITVQMCACPILGGFSMKTFLKTLKTCSLPVYCPFTDPNDSKFNGSGDLEALISIVDWLEVAGRFKNDGTSVEIMHHSIENFKIVSFIQVLL